MNTQISEKTLQDLEFPTVLQQVAVHCNTLLGKEKVEAIIPFSNKESLFTELALVNEYLASYQNENRIPNHVFEDCTIELQRLTIENSFLETDAFLTIAALSETMTVLKKFLEKFKSYYPTLAQHVAIIEYTIHTAQAITQIITPQATVADQASPVLKQLRKDSSHIRGKIGASFSSALSKANAAGYLDDIKESVLDNHRVLAVSAMYRRKVPGTFLGASKSGNIVYIVPQATLSYHRELQNLLFEEQQEILKILKELAQTIRPDIPVLKTTLHALVHLDIVAAKAIYAKETESLLPKIVENKSIYFKDAYHPILWKKNKSQGIQTIPQTIRLNEAQQIIVISGPNAGGKSITLKTIGLLQVMLQSGLLIPVHERSETSLFRTILSDIGDNQSIENQLSTYSYRLKNMRNFLRKCHDNTLFLIDEFGTGSDPELGGALAEIFLEEFHQKQAFGIITTHYANLKVLANELPNVVNANMQFDERSLEPLYKLDIGQAGSSFTFEVAQKNGIPFRIINQAKKRVETEKVRLDTMISKLQKERQKLQKTAEKLEAQKTKSTEQLQRLQDKEDKIQAKLGGFQELYDNNQKMLSIGRKVNEFLHNFFQTNNKKELTASFLKWVTIEKTKHLMKAPEKPTTKAARKIAKDAATTQKENRKQVEKEVLEKVVKVRQEKKIVAQKLAKERAAYLFQKNDKVRLIDGNAVGTIEKVEKKHVFINYGIFTTKAKVVQLELVEKAKK